MPVEAWARTKMTPRWIEHQRDPHIFLNDMLEMTAKALDVPASTISAVSDTHHDVRLAYALPRQAVATGPVPLSHSLCKHVVAMGRPLVVRDAWNHPLVRNSQALRESGVVAYIGEPLHDEAGTPVGSFCVFDDTARQWTATQCRIMSINAMIIEKALNWPDGQVSFPEA